MSKFIARVQLHKADETDYETLNREIEKDPAVKKNKKLAARAAMIKKGEYNYRGNITLKEVADAVIRAIKKTGRDYSFTVMKTKPLYNEG